LLVRQLISLFLLVLILSVISDGQRMSLGDPAFVSNVTSLQSFYLQKNTSKELADKITLDMTHTSAYYDPGNYTAQREEGTSHLVTADDSGMVVSLTSTVNYYFGSQLMTEDGIILNDEMVSPDCVLDSLAPLTCVPRTISARQAPPMGLGIYLRPPTTSLPTSGRSLQSAPRSSRTTRGISTLRLGLRVARASVRCL
jgi:hypothetical protein